MGCGESNHFGFHLPTLVLPSNLLQPSLFDTMIPRPSTLLVLLSALNYYCWFLSLLPRRTSGPLLTLNSDVSGALVTLLVPAAAADQALSGKYLGTDTQGHTSWSVGPGSPSGSFTDTDFPGGTYNRHPFSNTCCGIG